MYAVDVKYTYVVNGCISAFVLITASLLLRGRHEQVQARQAPLQLSFFWHPGYKWMLLWAFLTSESLCLALRRFGRCRC